MFVLRFVCVVFGELERIDFFEDLGLVGSFFEVFWGKGVVRE